MTESKATTERWLRWLQSDRDAGDVELRRRTLELLVPIRDQILDAARIEAGDTVLDVGAGDGLLGIGALERIGEGGHVIFADASRAVINNLREVIDALGERERCEFVVSPVTEVDKHVGESVNVVIQRSVLIYVMDVPAAIASIAGTLVSGGRVSLWEPVMSLLDPLATRPGEFFGWAVPEAAELATAVAEVYESLNDAVRPMRMLSIASLVLGAEQAGLDNISVAITAASEPSGQGDDAGVKRVLYARANPNVPTVVEAAEQALAPADARRFLSLLERAVRNGAGRMRRATAVLTARKTP